MGDFSAGKDKKWIRQMKITDEINLDRELEEEQSTMTMNVRLVAVQCYWKTSFKTKKKSCPILRFYMQQK